MTDSKDPVLEQALKQDVDLHGGDPTLALAVAKMSAREKNDSRANLRELALELGASLHRTPPDDAPGHV